MNLSGWRGEGSMSLPGSNSARKPSDAESDQFPAGLRVLVVDDDPTCLKILERMLRTCQYEVTKYDRAEYALNELRRNKNNFDIVISDVHMPDMDGFKLLEYIGLEMDLPVIMMSADDSKNVVMKGVRHGACDYLIKPVRIEALKNIWQHVVRKKKNEWQEEQDDLEYSFPANDGNWQSSKRKGDDEEGEEKDAYATLKKPRVVWSVELHQQFVAAVNHLGIDKAVPKKILELMNVPGLTRENVASHLQKYRLYLRKVILGPQHHVGLSNSFIGPQDPGFGKMSSLGGTDFRTLTVAGQFPRQILASYQPVLARSTIKPGISMPFFDQRNIFGSETSKLRFSEGKNLQLLSNPNRQVDLLHGIPPTTIEPKQLPSFFQSVQSLGSMNMQTNPQGSQSNSLLTNMVRPQSRYGNMMNESIGSQVSQIQSSMGRNILSTGEPVGILPRNVLGDKNQAMSYTVSQSSPAVDFSVNHVPCLQSNSFPVGSTPIITSSPSKGVIQEVVNLDVKGPRGLCPNYDRINELQQQKPQDWQIASSSYGGLQDTSCIENGIYVSPSVLVNQGFNLSQKEGQNGMSFEGEKTVLPSGPILQQGGSIQSVNNLLVESVSSMVNTETVEEVSFTNNHYPYEFAQDDLLSVMLEQQQESIGQVEGDLDFDGYSLDDIPLWDQSVQR